MTHAAALRSAYDRLRARIDHSTAMLDACLVDSEESKRYRAEIVAYTIASHDLAAAARRARIELPED